MLVEIIRETQYNNKECVCVREIEKENKYLNQLGQRRMKYTTLLYCRTPHMQERDTTIQQIQVFLRQTAAAAVVVVDGDDDVVVVLVVVFGGKHVNAQTRGGESEIVFIYIGLQKIEQDTKKHWLVEMITFNRLEREKQFGCVGV